MCIGWQYMKGNFLIEPVFDEFSFKNDEGENG